MLSSSRLHCRYTKDANLSMSGHECLPDAKLEEDFKVRLETSRFILRDFAQDDRLAFQRYQSDPRYRALYDIEEGDESTSARLFALFIEWQAERPRTNYQVGIFERQRGRLIGCGGVRLKQTDQLKAVLGLELDPDYWGRYRVALEVGECFAEFAFGSLHVEAIVSDTSSGNHRVTKIAERYGAARIAERQGPSWMSMRGCTEVDWALTREQWNNRPRFGRDALLLPR